MITIQDTIYMGTAAPASGGGGSITVDQTYDATSTNAQSGTAVAEAVATKQNVLTAGSNISINNNIISATDTTYSAFRGATSSVAGSTGLVPSPATGDREKYLKGDGTWATVSGGSGIQNTATGTNSLTILGAAANNNNALNIGVGTTAAAQSIALGSGTENYEGTNYGTSAGYNSIAIGYVADADNGISIGSFARSRNGGIAIGTGFTSEEGYEDYNEADSGIAIGNYAKAQDSIVIGASSTAVSELGGSIVIGNSATVDGLGHMILIGDGAAPVNSNGNPSTGYQFVIGSGERDSQTEEFINYLMLDLRTGKIPNDRIDGATGSFTSQDGKTITVTNGVITSIV